MACGPELKNKKIAVNMSFFIVVSEDELSGLHPEVNLPQGFIGTSSSMVWSNHEMINSQLKFRLLNSTTTT
jgi:hypothetical protein